MNLQGSICAITGGAGGIGQQIAFDFARGGAKVYVCDLNPSRLEAVRQKSEQAGLKITFSSCDVTDEQSVMGWFESIIPAEKRLDVLVNCAGITRDGLLVKLKDGVLTRMSVADFERVIAVNLKGTFLCGREAAAIMVRQGGGVIVNLSSLARWGGFGQTNYSASKAGVDAMTVAWSKELVKYKVRVAAVAPGYIDTEMVRAIRPEVLEKIISELPMRRLGQVTEISNTVRFIVENDYLTGRVLEIDGGLRE
jgi:3-oxoacyl-[acyl-carrier protein] reductase